MLKSYFNIALRSFLRDKKYSLINIGGLIIGLASVFIILAYVKYELSYDESYSNSSRIYRLTQTYWYNDAFKHSIYSPQGLGNVLQREVPGVKAAAEVTPLEYEFIINHEPVKINSIVANSNFFSIFNLPLKYGNPAAVLTRKRDVVVSENFAATYFPKQVVTGKQLFTAGSNGKQSVYTITGVMQNIPANTHFKADVIIANTWVENNFDLTRGTGQYILLDKNTTINQVEQNMPAIYKKYGFDSSTTIAFQAATSIHLHSNLEDEHFANSSITYIYVFLFVAAFTLLIACINYINFNTAKSLQRLKEIGVRKIMGAEQRQLSMQFIAESVLFFCTGIPFSILLAYLLWPVFTNMVNIQVPQSYLLGANFLLLLPAIAIVTGILAGAYAAFFVSRLRPAYILKDWQKSFVVNMRLRKVLIVFQFAISVALIISTVIANRQLYLLNNMELGFNRSQLIILPEERFKNTAQAFKDELLKNPGISGVSITGWDVGKSYGGFMAMDAPGDSTPVWQINVMEVDVDFFKTMQANVMEGRSFSRMHPEDLVDIDSLTDDTRNKTPLTAAQKQSIRLQKPIIISQPIAQMMHLKEPVVGTLLHTGDLYGTVVGEVKNFIGKSLLRKEPAVIFTVAPTARFGNTYIRISPQNTQATISHIRNTWKKFFPQTAFDFSFVDDRLNAQYDSQTRMAAIFNTFAALAIIIALLGLFSLVALTVQQKTKEIGIRKVLGAGITDIVQLLSKGYLSLIFIASLIAIPVTWWAMNKWLQDFNYRVTIHWYTFVAITLGCLVLALASIVIQTIKVAKANPVDSLRVE